MWGSTEWSSLQPVFLRIEKNKNASEQSGSKARFKGSFSTRCLELSTKTPIPRSSFRHRANPDLLALLQQGVAIWNEWREKNPVLVPDLIRANLSYATLHGRTSAMRSSLARLPTARTSAMRTSNRRTSAAPTSARWISATPISVGPTSLGPISPDNIYLLLNNREIRDVIDTITSKAVLILAFRQREKSS